MNPTTTLRITRRHRAFRGLAGLSTGAVLLATAATAVAAPAPAAHAPAGHVAPMASNAARGATMQLSQQQALAGTAVTVSGDAPLDARAGDWITLRSKAFAGGSVRTQVSAQGTYQVRARLGSRIAPGFYQVRGSLGSVSFPAATRQSLRISTAQLNGTMTVIYRNANGTAAAGTPVDIVGEAPVRAGRSIVFTSPALAGGTATAQVTAQGTYQLKVTIPANVRPGTYTLSGTYHGKTIADPTKITVS
jgi:hypothetical protein